MLSVVDVIATGSDGKAYVVVRVPGPRLPVPTRDNPHSSVEGMPRLQLRDGRAVHWLKDGRMQIADTEIFLTRQ